MNPLVIYTSIASSVANAILANRSDPGKVSEFVGYLNLASALATRFVEGDRDLVELDDQLKEAVAEDRGLTADQRAAWRQRDDIATDIATKWLADHPKEK